MSPIVVVKNDSSGPSIYMVTVLFNKTNEPSAFHRKRTWGWYREREKAEQAVLENHTDIFEAGYYTHAVIERVPETVCPACEVLQWYEASYEGDENNPRVKPVETPEWALYTGSWWQ